MPDRDIPENGLPLDCRYSGSVEAVVFDHRETNLLGRKDEKVLCFLSEEWYEIGVRFSSSWFRLGV